MAAVAVSCVLAVLVSSTQPRFADLVHALTVFAVVATVVAVAGGWSGVGVVAALALGSAVALTRFEEPAALDLRVVVIAPALLLLCELVSWSADATTSSAPRGRAIVVLVVIAGAVTALIASIATLPVGDAVGLAAAGVTSVALVVGALVRSARSVASRP